MAHTDPARAAIDTFYSELQTLPKLIGDLALSVAEAQRRLDQDYLESLTAFAKVVSDLVGHEGGDAAANRFISLFKAMAPSRYQFTETVVEVRADLQMTTASEFSGSAGIGITVPFAVSVNASYTKRNAYDYQASALVRTTLNAIPSSEAVMTALLPRAGEVIHADLPNANRYGALGAALGDIVHRIGSPH
jgi:hypothetical protein